MEYLKDNVALEREVTVLNVLSMLIEGFKVALLPINILYCAIGVILGTIVGALPGIGATSSTAMLLPLVFKINPASGLIMLAGIYYGSQYGNSISAVLLGIPGTSSAVMTAIDGHELHKKGKAGTALGISAIASFVGGTLSVIGLMILSPLLAEFALKFGPTQYFSIMVFSFSMVTAFSGKSTIRGLISMLLGFALSMVGLDCITGQKRFTFGRQGLLNGVDFVPICLGIFGIAIAMSTLEEKINDVPTENIDLSWRKILPTWDEILSIIPTMMRCSVVGFIVGVLPGLGATIASFMAYGTEQKLSKSGERFGTGEINAVAASETANNAATGGAFVPMLSLGIPGGAFTAVLLGAIMMFGITPGPAVFKTSSNIVWGLIASMYVGNIMLVIINVGFIPVIVGILNKVRPYLLLTILLLSTLGVYSLQCSKLDLIIMVFAGLLGYFMTKLDFPKPPLILGLLLGSKLEMSMRHALAISNGNISIFFEGPINKICLSLALISLIVSTLGIGRKQA